MGPGVAGLVGDLPKVSTAKTLSRGWLPGDAFEALRIY